jgi:GNAT superfamily N-acetyltransferase
VLTRESVQFADRDQLADLRAEAMEESLARLNLFDPVRARERFTNSFSPQHSQHVLWHGERAGVIVVKHAADQITLENLYLYKRFHNLGIGSLLLRALCDDADRAMKPIELNALKESDALRFYARFGFELHRTEGVDYWLRRAPVHVSALAREAL